MTNIAGWLVVAFLAALTIASFVYPRQPFEPDEEVPPVVAPVDPEPDWVEPDDVPDGVWVQPPGWTGEGGLR